MNNTSFLPEWAIPPGATLRTLMKSKSITEKDLSGVLETSIDEAGKLLDGVSALNEDVAQRLTKCIGGSVAFWLARETQYRTAMVRVDSAKQWLTAFPYSEMSRLGWIPPASEVLSQVHACLAFFDVTTTEEWFEKYSNKAALTAFRKTSRFESSDGAIVAWLRKGEIEARKIHSSEWGRSSLSESLSQLKALTRIGDPGEFISRLQGTLAESGVRVVVVRPPKGCKAHGATFFADGKPVILLSFRHLSDDQFWFTVFHEIGHLILHSDNRLFVEGDGSINSAEEAEANHFAATTLLPPHVLDELQRIGANARAVARFAKDLGIAPGVVVGQMQHRKLIGFAQLNNLKRRFKWGD